MRSKDAQKQLARTSLSLRFPCPLPKRISSRILSKSMFIPQNHPKSQQRVRTCAVIEKPVFRASLALSMLEIELYQIFLRYDRGRSGYEIKQYHKNPPSLRKHPFLLRSSPLGTFRETSPAANRRAKENGCFRRLKSSRITFQPRYANLLSSKITQHDIKIHKAGNISAKSFSSEKLIETNNIFTIRGKKNLAISIACVQTRHRIGVTKHMQLTEFLTVHIKPFSKET